MPAALYDSERYREDPIDSGPFRPLQWDKGQQIIIEPNEYDYGIQSPFRQITLVFLDGTGTPATSLLVGKVAWANPDVEFEDSRVDGAHTRR